VNAQERVAKLKGKFIKKKRIQRVFSKVNPTKGGCREEKKKKKEIDKIRSQRGVGTAPDNNIEKDETWCPNKGDTIERGIKKYRCRGGDQKIRWLGDKEKKGKLTVTQKEKNSPARGEG